MLKFKVLAEVVFASSHVSSSENEYRRIEVYPIVIITNSGYIHLTELNDLVTIDKPLTVFRCNDTEMVRRKTQKGSLIILDIEEHIKGVTTYEKDGVETQHVESAYAVNYVTGVSDTELLNLFENDLISEKRLNVYLKKNMISEL